MCWIIECIVTGREGCIGSGTFSQDLLAFFVNLFCVIFYNLGETYESYELLPTHDYWKS